MLLPKPLTQTAEPLFKQALLRSPPPQLRAVPNAAAAAAASAAARTTKSV